jgi:NAD(P)-dependent dehydrogenase (short-subunit alcohol dehydrogenase family)
LNETASLIRDAGDEATAITRDLGTVDEAPDATGIAASGLGAVEILLNNAAVVWPLGPTDALEPNAIQATLTINGAAAILLSGQVIPGTRDQRSVRTVNVSSEIAVRPASMVGMTVYAAGNAGLEAHTLNLARELDGSGVTVNPYRLAAVDTAMQGWIRAQRLPRIGNELDERFMAMRSDHAANPAGSAERVAR